MQLKRRVAALVGTVALGLAIGGVGVAVTGSTYLWLAVPVTLAVVWWFVATPQDCLCVDVAGGAARGRSAPADRAP